MHYVLNINDSVAESIFSIQTLSADERKLFCCTIYDLYGNKGVLMLGEMKRV